MLEKTLTKYFRKELTRLGYDDLSNAGEIQFSMGCYNGSYIQFPFSVICEADARTLCGRLMKGKEKAAVNRAIEKGVSFEAGGRYSSEWQPLDDNLTAFETASCDLFVEEINKDISDMSDRFILEGTNFFLAMGYDEDPKVIATRRLGRFKVVISKVCAEWSPLFEDDDEEQVAIDMQIIQGFFKEQSTCFDLRIQLYDRYSESEDAVAFVYYGSLTASVSDDALKVFRREIRDKLSEVVSDARSIFGRRLPKREAAFKEASDLAALNAIKEREREACKLLEVELEEQFALDSIAAQQHQVKWAGLCL